MVHVTSKYPAQRASLLALIPGSGVSPGVLKNLNKGVLAQITAKHLSLALRGMLHAGLHSTCMHAYIQEPAYEAWWSGLKMIRSALSPEELACGWIVVHFHASRVSIELDL